MTRPGLDEPITDEETRRKRAIAGLRRAMWKLAGLATVVSLVGIVGQQAPEPLYAALFAVLTGLAVSAVIASSLVLVFAGTYAEDHGSVSRRLQDNIGYFTRAATFGLAAAGVGALLATALPVRLSGAIGSSSGALPAAGWIAIVFGAVGVALGILEEWRERQNEGPDSTR